MEKVNALLHEFAPYILGRMGIPYRRRAINIISVAMEAPQDAVNTPHRQARTAPRREAQRPCTPAKSTRSNKQTYFWLP